MNIYTLRARFRDAGCRTILAKQLSCNDNSKNQIYLGGDFSAINLLPFSAISTDNSKRAGSKGPRLKAAIRFRWLTGGDAFGSANLILYPKYPEVRLSGLLIGGAPDDQAALVRRREAGRLLFFGVNDLGGIIGHRSSSDDELTASFHAQHNASPFDQTGVFFRIPVAGRAASSYELLITALRRIINQGWIASKRLDGGGRILECRHPNCGGFTLEAELGVRPNSLAAPDYEGWEVKQYGVRNLERPGRQPITLMTPEPDGGLVVGPTVFLFFLGRWGWQDARERGLNKMPAAPTAALVVFLVPIGLGVWIPMRPKASTSNRTPFRPIPEPPNAGPVAANPKKKQFPVN